MASVAEVQERLRVAQVQRRLDKALSAAGKIDSSGAPPKVRALVGAAPEKDRLATLRKFFPDARPSPDGTNFLFRNPATGKVTVYNPKGLDIGDVASVAREGGQAIGGALGAIGGAAIGGGLPGAILGGAAGTEAGDQAAMALARSLGTEDTRNIGEQLQDSAFNIGSGGVGEGAGAAMGAGARGAARSLLRSGGQSSPEIHQIIKDFGVAGSSPTVGQATDRRLFQAFEGILSRAPGGAGRIAKVAQRTIDNIGATVQRRAQRLSSGQLTPEAAGGIIESGVEGFVGRFKNTGEQLFGQVDRFIRPDAPVSVLNTKFMLDKITGPIAGATNLSQTKLFSNPALKEVADALALDAGNTGTLPYGVLKQIRSRLGRKIAAPRLVDDVSVAELKQVYGSITEDMKAAATVAGPQATKAFNRANQFWRSGMDRIEKVLQKVIAKNTPEDIFRSLEISGREGATRLRRTLRSLTKDERDVVSATVLNRLGLATPGRQGAVGETFSVETFLTNWNRISPEAKAVLFSEGTLRKDLDAIARVTERLRESSKVFANPSGTAGQQVGQSLLFVGAGSGAAGLAFGSMELLALPAFLAVGAINANAAARLMTSPNFVRWLARSTKVKPAGIGAHLGRLGTIAANSDPDTRTAIMGYLELVQRSAATSQAQEVQSRTERR